MARYKVNNREVPHLWAHQAQDHAEGSSIFFRGKSIYSYGTHFEAGRIVTRKGETVALITTATYSNSTAKHMGYVRMGARHLTCFHVYLHDGKTEVRQWWKSYVDRYNDALVDAALARTSTEWKLNRVHALVNEANEFAKFFGLKSRIVLPSDIDALLADTKAKAIKAQAIARKKTAKENAVRRKRDKAGAEIEFSQWQNGELGYINSLYAYLIGKDRIEAAQDEHYKNREIYIAKLAAEAKAAAEAEFLEWKAGERAEMTWDSRRLIDENRISAATDEHNRNRKIAVASIINDWRNHNRQLTRESIGISDALLRLSKDGSEVETSMGARFPADHGKRAYRILRKLRNRHESYKRNGHTIRVGHYEVDEMNVEGFIQAGCHHITWEEVETLAKLAGWDKDPDPVEDSIAA